MRQIAIITPKIYDSGYDGYDKVIESITDWSEVTEEEYKLLYSYCINYDYEIIERQDIKPDFLLKTIEQAKVEAKKHQEKLDKQKEENERKKQAALLKKKAKTEAEEKKLLEQLKSKYKE